jgi:curved DNA-binding protein CbpA
VRDLYAILQVIPGADAVVITAAYRALARLHHPDSGGEARAMMRLNAAWEILGDPYRRRLYDEARRREAAARAAAPTTTTTTSAASGPGTGIASVPRDPGVSATAAAQGRATPPDDASDSDMPAGIRVRRAVDATVMDFGRYEGRSIAELARMDPDYLLWLARTPAGRRYEPEIRARLHAVRPPDRVPVGARGR